CNFPARGTFDIPKKPRNLDHSEPVTRVVGSERRWISSGLGSEPGVRLVERGLQDCEGVANRHSFARAKFDRKSRLVGCESSARSDTTTLPRSCADPFDIWSTK